MFFFFFFAAQIGKMGGVITVRVYGAAPVL